MNGLKGIIYLDTESSINTVTMKAMADLMTDFHNTFKKGNWFQIPIIYPDELSDFPWIRDVDHLTRINKYRKRVGQSLIRFSDDDMTELALTGR